jgi:hypothetical protein
MPNDAPFSRDSIGNTAGRDPQTGRFVEGNKGGPGRPPRAVEERMLQMLIDVAMDPDTQAAFQRALQAKLCKADPWASDLVIDRMLGKAVQRQEIAGVDGANLPLIELLEELRNCGKPPVA